MTKVLELKELKKTFFDVGEKPFEVLANINLEVHEGEFVSIIGPSGCGKSILLYLIAGFLGKTSGNIFLDGVPIEKPGTDRMMVFQNYVLLPWKTVYENVLFALEKSEFNKREKEKLVNHYLELMGLSNFRNWYPHKLSGGMKQRVSIARALVANSKILLMDEPFSAVDSQRRRQLRKNLLEIWEKTKMTVLFVTHSIGEALYLSDVIYVMKRRPSNIKKCYKIDLPRPRDIGDPSYVKIKEQIEKDLLEEFDKINVEQDSSFIK